MGDYDLSGLSSRSFEKLVQALAVKVLGAGTVVFGDGPDGGREATFEGRMDYPSRTDPWDGYCVIQAKFRQRPEGSASDGKWALAELEKELKRFVDRKKGRRIPDYYIYATNVVLSPTKDKGAKDKAVALIDQYRKRTSFKGWQLWDFDQIGAFLDDASDIRRAYAAWITPGDVLAEVLVNLQPRKLDFLDVMTSFLARDLLRDQYANLEQAGHAAEDRIPLARVFVDLPTTLERITEPLEEEDDSQPKVAELVATLVEAAKDSHDPVSTLQHDRTLRPGDKWMGSDGWDRGRYVLIGGPGQGKTTVGQFVCQLFRAALLKERPRSQLSAEVLDALNEVEKHCTEEKLELPPTRRFPIRIVLSELASALSKEPELSLLEYIGTLIRKRTGREVSIEDLRNWLGLYPWLLVLDGLDEVPASTNRELMLRQIEELWIDAAQCEADLLVLATTRPQGYGDDFSPQRYRHLWMSPLSVKRALGYARRLVDVRYSGDEERKGKVFERLIQASSVDATARLMRSPLQVTILATLVDVIGPPPQDRWKLFHDYYEVIYRRERERDIPAANILRDHRANIDAIHHRVGLSLQLETERAGGTEARLSANRFAGIVASRLAEEGYEGDELQAIQSAIIEAAANRLVFLVGLETNQVGFEIRSLQEFMSAEALLSGNDEDTLKRLRCIAPITSWRNAFLFAAGRCFSQPDREHFRDTIFTICEMLNDEEFGDVAQAVLAGSHLALDLLEDGVALRQPKYSRLLAKCACRLLDQPPADVHTRLAELAQGGPPQNVLRSLLEHSLGRGLPSSLGAWASLLPLLARNVGWAADLADRHWPTDASSQLSILGLLPADLSGQWFVTRMEEALGNNHPKTGLHSLFSSLSRRAMNSRAESGIMKFYIVSLSFDLGSEVKNNYIQTYVNWIADAKRSCALIEQAPRVREVHAGWLPLIEARRFSAEPSARSLASTLEKLAAQPEAFPLFVSGPCSWVLEACLRAVSSPADATSLALRAATGELADKSAWIAAEKRWNTQGIDSEDICYMIDAHWPFDLNIATKGVPLGGLAIIKGSMKLFRLYVDTILGLDEASKLQATLAGAALAGFRSSLDSTPPVWLKPESILRLLGCLESGVSVRVSTIINFAKWALNDEGWIRVLEFAGLRQRVHPYGALSKLTELWDLLIRLLRSFPDRQALLVILAKIARTGASTGLPRELDIRYEKYAEPEVRRSALLLELAEGRMTVIRARELACATVELRPFDHELLRDAGEVLRNLERFDSAAEIYLLELGKSVPHDNTRGERIILDLLEHSFRRHTSNLAVREVWQSLALPAGLL